MLTSIYNYLRTNPANKDALLAHYLAEIYEGKKDEKA